MAKKRKRRLGHVTNHEKRQVRTAIYNAAASCGKKFRNDRLLKEACYDGTSLVEINLEETGFDLGKTRR